MLQFSRKYSLDDIPMCSNKGAFPCLDSNNNSFNLAINNVKIPPEQTISNKSDFLNYRYRFMYSAPECTCSAELSRPRVPTKCIKPESTLVNYPTISSEG